MTDIPSKGEIENGMQKLEFVPSSPPEKSGKHRYVFLLFEHSSKIGDSPATNKFPEGRGGFKVNEYVKNNKLGNPKHVNFYYTERP